MKKVLSSFCVSVVFVLTSTHVSTIFKIIGLLLKFEAVCLRWDRSCKTVITKSCLNTAMQLGRLCVLQLQLSCACLLPRPPLWRGQPGSAEQDTSRGTQHHNTTTANINNSNITTANTVSATATDKLRGLSKKQNRICECQSSKRNWHWHKKRRLRIKDIRTEHLIWCEIRPEHRV